MPCPRPVSCLCQLHLGTTSPPASLPTSRCTLGSASAMPGCLLLQNLQHLGGGGDGVSHSSVWDQPSQNSFLSCFWKVSSVQSLPHPPAMTSMPRGPRCQLHLPLKLSLHPHGFPRPLPGFLRVHFLGNTAHRSIRRGVHGVPTASHMVVWSPELDRKLLGGEALASAGPDSQ